MELVIALGIIVVGLALYYTRKKPIQTVESAQVIAVEEVVPTPEPVKVEVKAEEKPAKKPKAKKPEAPKPVAPKSTKTAKPKQEAKPKAPKKPRNLKIAK